MKHSDFKIGVEFKISGKRWRCTDVATRVIVAISLEPREVVRSYVDDAGTRIEEKYLNDDPRDLIGPPYGVTEYVFDEYDLDACEPDTDEELTVEVEKRVQEIDAGKAYMLDGEKVFATLREKYQQSEYRMEKLHQYRQWVMEILEEHAQFKPAYGDVNMELIFDKERDRYQLMTIGWREYQRYHGSILHVDIRDGMIWIQHDGTEGGIANKLVELGVPKEDIVLAFHAPYKRKFTDFATGEKAA